MSGRRLLATGLLWLLWIWGIALLSNDPRPWPGHPWQYDLERRAVPLARWDSGWYLRIVEQGYQRPPSRMGQQTNHAFFPLYPGLIRAVVRTTGLESSMAGCLLSALALLGTLPLLAGWVKAEWGEAAVKPTILVFLLFPTSFFFAALYTEALVLLLSVGAVRALQKERPLIAAACGLLAGLTRVSGLLLAPFLFLDSLRRSYERAGRLDAAALGRALFVGAAPAMGFGLFCLYFYKRFGDPLLFFTAQHNWATYEKSALQGPYLIYRDLSMAISSGRLFRDPGRMYEGVYLLLFALLALLLVRSGIRLGGRRLDVKPDDVERASERKGVDVLLFVKTGPVVEALYVSSLVGLVLLSGTLESSGRYVLPAFPAFVILAGLSRYRIAFPLWLAASAMAQAAYVFFFVNWIWAG